MVVPPVLSSQFVVMYWPPFVENGCCTHGINRIAHNFGAVTIHHML